MAFTIEQRVFVLKYYWFFYLCASFNDKRTYSENVNISKVIDQCQKEFKSKFNCDAPSIKTIKKYVEKFGETGSVDDKEHDRKKTVLTESKIEEVKNIMEDQPQTSLRRLSAQLDI